MSLATSPATQLSLGPYAPADLPFLVAFLNHVLAGHRHWVSITEAEYAERVLEQPGFDPAGLMLARAGREIVGGVHAFRPPPAPHSSEAQDPRHAIAWLAVSPAWRGRGLGGRLLSAAEDYLYYCPAYFAPPATPLYGIMERLWAPWYGSTDHMAISAVRDRELVAWLGERGYSPINPGEVSLAGLLHHRERPNDPGLARHGLHCMAISERSPWEGEETLHMLHRWDHNGGRPYHGLVIADGRRAVGNIVWYPLPDGLTCAVAWLGLDRHYRGLRFGAYLLDRALAEMAGRGYLYVETAVHARRQAEALHLFKNRGFQVIDYWVTLVKT